jgi:hypothetical protein
MSINSGGSVFNAPAVPLNRDRKGAHTNIQRPPQLFDGSFGQLKNVPQV